MMGWLKYKCYKFVWKLTDLKISVGQGTLSDPFVNLSDVERKPLDILSDLSEAEVYLSDPRELVSDLTVSLSNVNQNVA